MLIQLPGASSSQPGSRNAEGGSSFEAGLRRDLASAPIVSYDAMLGGVAKRAIDLALTLLTLPLWLPLLLTGAIWAKLRQGGRVFYAQEHIGYGGRAFRRFSLRLRPSAANVESLHPSVASDLEGASDWATIAGRAETRRAKWGRVLERLPQLFNVIGGDMALVGPKPLSREQLEPLRSARRYYLSARPGVIGVSAIAAEDQEESGQYKIYALAWAISTDALIMWDALRSLWRRGELWTPGLRLAKSVAVQATAEAAAARRGRGA
jgi:lipopolysaccharide/colanic/teichoic acid biosynthesis glycosyltransferase